MQGQTCLTLCKRSALHIRDTVNMHSDPTRQADRIMQAQIATLSISTWIEAFPVIKDSRRLSRFTFVLTFLLSGGLPKQTKRSLGAKRRAAGTGGCAGGWQ